MSQTPSTTESIWKKCSSCKKPILYATRYWVCNVSTCNRKRLGLAFCSTECWDAHLPLMNHRESWAEERKAPTHEEWKKICEEEAAPKKRERKAFPEADSETAAQAEVTTPAKPAVILRKRSSEST